MNNTSALSAFCSAGHFPTPSLFGAEILSISSHLITNYSQYVPDTFNYNHPSSDVKGVDFCNVTVTYTHPGQNDTINVETWLPLKWNERLQAIGGGGTVAGRFYLSYVSMAGAVGEGYATVSTDAGISTDPGAGSITLLSPGNINLYDDRNFGSVSLNDEAVIAKSLIQSFYGRPPRYSYWSGCSQGGRQGMMLAQRYPTAYDGIVASAPAMHINAFAGALYYPQLVMQLRGQYPYNCEVNAITAAAIEACDAADGVADGLIADPDACDFDPFSVVGDTIANCSDTGTEMRISEMAAVVANASWSGPISPDGKRIWFGLEKGAQLAGAGGIAATQCANGTCVGESSNIGWLQGYVLRDPDWTPANLTLEAYAWMMHVAAVEWNWPWGTNDPDLTAFRNAGGKLLTYHGLADPAIPPKGTRHYYEAVSALMPDVRDFYRVFEVPGLGHCSGGSGGQPVTIFEQMRAWVENGTAPDSMPISFEDSKNVTQNRILCPLPQKAKFNSTCGDGAKAECFYCAGSI